MSTEEEKNEPRTWAELAQDALEVQDACNLSGVVHSFSRIIIEVRARLEQELGEKFSTDALNHHPICVLYSDKIADLTGTQSSSSLIVSEAYVWMDRRIKLAKG